MIKLNTNYDVYDYIEHLKKKIHFKQNGQKLGPMMILNLLKIYTKSNIHYIWLYYTLSL